MFSSLISILNEIFHILAVISHFIVERFVYLNQTLFPVGVPKFRSFTSEHQAGFHYHKCSSQIFTHIGHGHYISAALVYIYTQLNTVLYYRTQSAITTIPDCTFSTGEAL